MKSQPTSQPSTPSHSSLNYFVHNTHHHPKYCMYLTCLLSVKIQDRSFVCLFWSLLGLLQKQQCLARGRSSARFCLTGGPLLPTCASPVGGALGALCPPCDRARSLALLHCPLRQLYGHSRYPEAAVKAEAAAELPRSHLGRPEPVPAAAAAD